MDIEVIIDTICPWCYIGKRRLEQALALRSHVAARLIWRPFLLNREMPADGANRTAYLIRKFGSEARVRRIYGAISQAGESVDINFDFDRIDRTPNSVDSHRIVQLAQEAGFADAMVEALYHAHFVEGLDLGERDVLLEIAATIGLNASVAQAHLDSDVNIDLVYDENTRAHRMGINGVPAFVFNESMVISGAQEPQVLARMIDAAAAMETAA